MKTEHRAVLEAIEGVKYSLCLGLHGFDGLTDIFGSVEVPVIEDIMPDWPRRN